MNITLILFFNCLFDRIILGINIEYTSIEILTYYNYICLKTVASAYNF